GAEHAEERQHDGRDVDVALEPGHFLGIPASGARVTDAGEPSRVLAFPVAGTGVAAIGCLGENAADGYAAYVPHVRPVDARRRAQRAGAHTGAPGMPGMLYGHRIGDLP